MNWKKEWEGLNCFLNVLNGYLYVLVIIVIFCRVESLNLL